MSVFRMSLLTTVGGAAFLLSSSAMTQDREREQAVNGTYYAVIAPIYDGSATSGGSDSYIRLFNGKSTATTFTLTVVGSPSGNVYGTATFSVPGNASQQKHWAQVVGGANAGPLTGGDTSYAMYLRNPDPLAGYQHVTFHQVTTFFENASICDRLLNEALVSTGKVVMPNVHTTQLGGYPSKLQIHNYQAVPVNYQVSAVYSETGAAAGSAITVPMAANETRTLLVSELQSQMGFGPSEAHVNFFVRNPGASKPNVLVGHQVANNQLGADFNFSTACAANPAAPVGSDPSVPLTDLEREAMTALEFSFILDIQPVTDIFGLIDANADESVSLAEFTAIVAAGRGSAAAAEALFTRIDPGVTGAVSSASFVATMQPVITSWVAAR
jgi:hypothetical protein